uniref:Uncharacterized protein n=1 Tax=Megaviridae environmental sample TaxID=1737588 RepID=A0A5J6VJK0_9VIRU|nr:MAG: hypothetical protein [Megaviridae environmental sample]
MEKLYIGHYEFIEEDITSSFIFHLEYNTISSTYNFNVPSNPLFDIEMLKLIKNTSKISEILLKLNNIVIKKKYCKKTTDEIFKFKHWILSQIKTTEQISIGINT